MRALLIILFAIFSNFLYGQYYVATDGNDNNPGSLKLPFKTIQKAASVLKAGDSCIIREGIYRETVKIQTSGTRQKPIVFSAYKNEKVVITGTDKIGDWKVYKPDVYFKVVKKQVFQLSINDNYAPEAAYPDINTDNVFDQQNWLQVRTLANGTCKFIDKKFPENYWQGATLIAFIHFRWVALNGKISYNSDDSLVCITRSTKWNQSGYRKYIGEGIAYLTGHINALDKENEWLWKDDTLFVFSSGNLNDKKVEAQFRTYGFDCSAKSSITIRNISFTYCSADLGAAKNCMVDNCRFENICPFFTHNESFDRFMKSPEDTINYGISHWSGKGIKLSGFNNTIQNSWINGSWGDGISIGGQNNKVVNCLIKNCNRSGTDAAGIAVIGKNHHILNNTIKFCGRSGIVHNDSRKIKILYNKIHDCGLLTFDAGLTYCFKTNGENTEIAYNWLFDNRAIQLGEGLYIDNYSSNFIIHHNVIWNCYIGIRVNKPAQNITIFNNTVLSCDFAQATSGYIDVSELKNIVVFNNLSDKTWSEGTELDRNISMFNFPKTKEGKPDFYPFANSAAIDFGIIKQAYTLPYKGKAPDAGAYEWEDLLWKAGCFQE